ncbi:hypothetical protein ACO1K3_13975, partial [Staphylococcus aureus]
FVLGPTTEAHAIEDAPRHLILTGHAGLKPADLRDVRFDFRGQLSPSSLECGQRLSKGAYRVRNRGSSLFEIIRDRDKGLRPADCG